jgi:hypothetical protein
MWPLSHNATNDDYLWLHGSGLRQGKHIRSPNVGTTVVFYLPCFQGVQTYDVLLVKKVTDTKETCSAKFWRWPRYGVSLSNHTKSHRTIRSISSEQVAFLLMTHHFCFHPVDIGEVGILWWDEGIVFKLVFITDNTFTNPVSRLLRLKCQRVDR